jgi:predicted neuraminidase
MEETKMRHFSILIALIAVQAALATDIRIERVIGEEIPGKYKHPASITELDNGDLYLSYYGGGGEYEDDSKVWAIRKAPGAEKWTAPVVIADTPFLAEGNPVVWQAPDGLVWLWFVQRYGETWSDSRIHAKISRDGAKTWSDSFVVAFEKGMMVRAKPIVLHDGNYLLPIYHETGNDREVVGADTTSLFLRYDPKAHTFTESSRISSRIGNLQPSVAQIDDNYLIAYARRAGGYEPREDAWLVRSESRDGGKTWAPGTETTFPNPNAATDFMKLQSGNLLIVYNDSKTDRGKLTVGISTDTDKTYKRRVISEASDDLAYPYVIQGQDGLIHLIYTDFRTTIYHATFTEDAILKKHRKGGKQ